MKNKKVKQMLFDVIVKGRKAIWYGDENEIVQISTSYN